LAQVEEAQFPLVISRRRSRREIPAEQAFKLADWGKFNLSDQSSFQSCHFAYSSIDIEIPPRFARF